MARFAVTWGNPPADMYDFANEVGYWAGPWYCVACGALLPRRAAVQCGECAHAWRWGWLLSLHNVWMGLRMLGPSLDDEWGTRAPWWRLDRWAVRLRYDIRRPSKVWVCPCCAHDL